MIDIKTYTKEEIAHNYYDITEIPNNELFVKFEDIKDLIKDDS